MLQWTKCTWFWHYLCWMALSKSLHLGLIIQRIACCSVCIFPRLYLWKDFS
jgi:hypothetical protein